jgi:hypothetical protein
MITRTYVVKMPEEVATTPLYILVTDDPGSQDAPVVAGTDGAYYEIRGRPLRIPVLASEGPSEGFVPRCRLGFLVSVTAFNTSSPVVMPRAQLSESLTQNLSSTDSGPTISVPTLADPSGSPAILMLGSTGTEGGVYLVTLMCPEAKDEDRSNTGVG